MALVYLIAELSLHVERKMSLIAPEHKAEIRNYQHQAQTHLQDSEALSQWLENLQAKEQTFATVISIQHSPLTGVLDNTEIAIQAGRNLDHAIHLYHDNPIIHLPLDTHGAAFLFRLPDRMMPGKLWPAIHLGMHLALPMIIMVIFSVLLYRHVMTPIRQLERATQRFSAGDYTTRLTPEMRGRDDELGRLATTFDQMASRVGELIQSQRHLIHDLSHELRTPLQRLELCLPNLPSQHEARVRHEVDLMRKLTEDTLTLAWMQSETRGALQDHLDLCTLIDVIADDCRFEFPNQALSLQLPRSLYLQHTSERALSQAIENILRNALRYTPIGKGVSVTLHRHLSHCELTIVDQGPGVPDALLGQIFAPFFRVDKARGREAGGFGLGLALAKRHIESIGGTITAYNSISGGLTVNIELPINNASCKTCKSTAPNQKSY